MIASPTTVMTSSVACFEPVLSFRFRLFFHLRNFDPLQYVFNTLIHFAQRFANVAAVSLVALAANRNA